MRFPPLLFRYTSCLALLAAPIARAEKLVVARSVVSDEYLRKRTLEGKRQPQTYVFMAGRYFAGTRHDNSLEKTSFPAIAERLAPDLRRQDFYPAKSLGDADLLLIVHWGVTVGRNRDSVALSTGLENLATIALAAEDAQRDLAEAVARGDMEGVRRANGDLGNLQSDTKSEFQNIHQSESAGGSEDSGGLLGFSAALRKEPETLAEYERQQTLHELAKEECYFVIVMAYDAPTFTRDKQLKRVWTLRTSISSAGVNFHQALDRIGNIAGRYFATKQQDVTFDNIGDRKRTEHVDLKELKILGMVDAPK